MSDSLIAKEFAARKRTKSSNLLTYDTENRQEGFFYDVTIEVGVFSISHSRMVLAFHSKFFEGMFQTNKEKFELMVEIQGVSGRVVKAIIDYFYTESIYINGEMVWTGWLHPIICKWAT